MCGIAGFFNPSADYTKEKNYRNHILEMMNQVQKHRGPDDEGTFLSPQCGLAHVRLNIIDLVTGHQPMRRVRGDHSCVIAYNGEIYNAPELKAELISEGEQFLTSGDTEVILAGFMRCGPSFIKKLNGIFAIALWDESCQTLHLFRDRLGVKPLFYTKKDETTIFSSEIKGLFAYPDIVPELDRNSLNEIFALGPAKTYGKGVFKNILEVLPANTFPLVTLLSKDSFTGNLAAASTLIRLLIQSKKRDGFSQIPSKSRCFQTFPSARFFPAE